MTDAALVFAQALLIGLAIAAPVGPIGLLVIQRTLQHGWLIGLATGLGAAAADALYGAVGAFGVGAVTDWLTATQRPLALAGAAFMAWLAWQTWRAAPAAAVAEVKAGPGLAAAFAGTFVLTLSNPATILSFVAIFASLGAGAGSAHPGVMVTGVFAGSLLWWLLLCGGVARLRAKLDARWQRRINAAAALLLLGFALWAAAVALLP